jgi:hypothetical protein
MSQTIELPDAVYTALKKAAEAHGTTPAEWIAAQLPAAEEGPSAPPPTTLADLFAGRVGRIRSGGKERLSENCGEKFTEYLKRKQAEGHL